VSPVKYELGFYIPEDAILHSHRRENLKSYIFQESLENQKKNNEYFTLLVMFVLNPILTVFKYSCLVVSGIDTLQRTKSVM
jgi:hypothetical protein